MGILLSPLVCWAQSSVGGCRLDKQLAARWRKNKDRTKYEKIKTRRAGEVGVIGKGGSDCIVLVSSSCARPISMT